MGNVININKDALPADLMSFKELYEKYGLKYGYLHLKSKIENKMQAYKVGVWKLSEKEVLEFIKNESRGINLWQG